MSRPPKAIRVTERTSKTRSIHLSRAEVLEALCKQFGFDQSCTAFKAQGLMGVELIEETTRHNDRSEIIEEQE